MLARIFVTVGGLIVLALLAALVGPYFIDWTSYRADFERNAGAILGRPVKVNGEASARLVPFPSVTFSDVTIGDGSDGLPPSTVEQFSMDAELAPFLRGEVLIFDMRLVRPRTVVAVGEDGRMNWAVRYGGGVSGQTIELERMRITDGEVRLVRPGLPDRLLTDVEATLSAKSLGGPWRAEGTLRADGKPMHVSLSTGTLAADGLRVKLKAEPDGASFVVDAEGNVAAAAGVLNYSGEFRLSEPAPAVQGLRDGDGKPVEARPDPGNRVRGKFTLDDKRLVIDEFRFETGPLADPYVADGSGAVEFGAAPSFSIRATGAQVRLGSDADPGRPTMSLAERTAQLADSLARLPKPALPGVVDIDLPAVVAGATTIRDVKLRAETQGDAWRIERLNAILPGRSSLEVSGMLEQGDEPAFKGEVVLAVGQPSGFAGWLANDIDAPVRRLSQAGFSAGVEISSAAQRFRNLELILGGSRFKGSAERTVGPGERPLVELVLRGGAVSADEAAAVSSLFLADGGRARFAGQDLKVEIQAGPVGDETLGAAGVDTVFRIADDRLDIDKLSINGVAGATMVGTGRIEALSSAPKVSADMAVIAPDLAPLARLAGSLWPDNRLLAYLNRNAEGYASLLTDARIDVLATAAEGDTLALDVKGLAGGSDISAKLDMSGSRDKPLDAAVALEARIANPDATALSALVGLPSLPLGLVGKGDLLVSAKGSANKGLDTRVAASAEGASLSFSGTVLAPEEGIQLRGAAKLDAADIEPWLMTTGIALPGMGVGMQTALAADIDYGNGLLVLADVSGTVSESAVSGDVNVETKQGVPIISGALETDELDLQPLAEIVLGQGSFDSVDEIWPQMPFKQTYLFGLQADLDVNAATLAAGGTISASDASLSLKLDSNGLHIPQLSARLGDASLTGMFELRNSEATGLLTGQFRLSDAKIERLLPELGVAGAALSGSADVSASLSGSGKSIGALIASLAGSGTVALRGLDVGQVNPDAFAQIIEAADRTGRDIDAARVAAFAPPIVHSGHFAAGSAEIPFTLAAGVVRLPPVSFGTGQAKLTSDLKLDLNTLEISGAGEIAYAPGVEALVGAEPTVNIVLGGHADLPTLAIDTQPLAQFLTQRALEIEQARVEAMQDVLLEKQRLRREVRYYAALDAARAKAEADRLAAEAEARRVAEEARKAEAARLQAEAEAKRQAAEAERVKLEEEARRKADEAQRQAEEAARAAAERESRLKAEEDARQRAQEERQRAQEEAARRRTQETAPSEQQPVPAAETPQPAQQPPVQAPTPQPKPPRQPSREKPPPAKPVGPFPPAPILPGNSVAPSSSNSLR